MNDRNLDREANRWVVDNADPEQGRAAMVLIALTALVVLAGALYGGWAVVKGLWR